MMRKLAAVSFGMGSRPACVCAQYNGASVVIISPDSDNLSVLQAALLGLDLRKHAELGLRPGEVRAVQLATETPALYSGKVVCARPPNCL